MDPSHVAALNRVLNAHAPDDLFGRSPSTTSVAAEYKRLAAMVHPDLHAGSSREKSAHEAMAKLNALRDKAESALGAPPRAPMIVQVGKRRLELGARAFRGDLCDLYACRVDDEAEAQALLKVPQHPGDNDLVTAEANALRILRPAGGTEIKLHHLLPRAIETFSLRSSKSTRPAVLMPWYRGYVSLQEVERAYPQGLDFRDLAWMVRRLLSALGVAHRAGLVHGAVLPPHVLVQPQGHGARLVDWCYSVPIGRKLTAIPTAYRGWYPPEALAKQPLTPAADIYMVARLARAALNASAPAIVMRFFDGCMMRSPALRPQDAWQLHDEFGALLERIVGPPAYREFRMPDATN